MSRQKTYGEAQAFLREVVFPYAGTECLIWPYGKSRDGYGRVRIGRRMKLVSTVVCEYFHGAAPSPLHEAAHSCGNGRGACVAGNHLRWATGLENASERTAHGMTFRGEQLPQHLLTKSDVRLIRQLAGTMKQKDMAALFGVKQATISNVVTRKNWAWLDD